MKRARNRKRPGGGDEGGGGWEVVYSGFVLILLCFFIMLSSFASIQEGRVVRFVKSFIDSVSMMPGGVKFTPGDRILPPSPDLVYKESDIAAVYRDLQQAAEHFEMNRQMELSLTGGGILMQLTETVLFDSGEAQLREEARPFLRRMGEILGAGKHGIRVEGHTDDVPIHTARFPSNWELSTARAVNVLRYFVEQGYVEAGRISAVGHAEFKPVDTNDTPEGRARNRRVEIFIRAEKNAQGGKP